MTSQVGLHPLVPVAQVVGLVGSSALTAYVATFSIVTVPALRAARSTSTEDISKQWKLAYDLGKYTAPPMSLVCAAIYGFVAFQTRHLTSTSSFSPSLLYTAAAIIAACPIPFTVATMFPSIKAISAKAEGKADAPSDAEVKAQLESWSTLNAFRSMLPGTATILAATAMLL